ncbi:lanC-like protein 3 isoform X1 [Gordionus sp. m RMFG-2023]|uniref:lanC-like protein 3 isoform X1 n=2 Tax=Gordionus sp. m RMFG-2023 TaxID=3053472 RepID=UPI0031FC929A
MFLSNILKRLQATVNNADGGLYVGIGGVAYALYKILSLNKSNPKILSLNEDEKQLYADNMLNYIKVSLQNLEKDKKHDVAFILGNAGINAVGSIIYSFLACNAQLLSSFQPGMEKKFIDISNKCINNYANGAVICQNINLHHDIGGDEYFIGRAGYLSGLKLLEDFFGKKIVDDSTVKKILEAMIQSGRKYSISKNHQIFPLMYSYYGTEYLGAAHGLCSNLKMILTYQSIVQTIPNAMRDVTATLDTLLDSQWEDGNFAPTLMEIAGGPPNLKDELVHWCHGAPGVIYLLAKAYLLLGDVKYLKAAERCGELIWQKGLLKKGPGLCHGIAGNAYAFLLLYRLMPKGSEAKNKWLTRSYRFAEFIFTPEFEKGSRIPDSPYSLYEGIAGTACFLADLMVPEQAHFPFYDTF